MKDDIITRLKPGETKNNPDMVTRKLRDLAESGKLVKLVAIAVVEYEPGLGAEVIIGSDNMDRYDMLSASQICRMVADTYYKQLLMAGEAAGAGPLN